MLIMSEYRSFDANPEHAIPRMTFTFDVDGVGGQTEFNFEIPVSDLESAVVLPDPLELIPEPGGLNPHVVIGELETENKGGKLKVTETDNSLQVTLGFTPLPPKDEISAEQQPNYFERMKLESAPRIPQLKGREDLFDALVKLTNIQYQFGIPLNHPDVDFSIAPAPARLSFADGRYANEPRFIATREFEDTRRNLSREESQTLTNELYDYLVYLDPNGSLEKEWVLGGVAVGAHGRIFSNGHSGFGQRDEGITNYELTDTDTFVDNRLQSGDAYYCRGHNLEDLLSSPRLMALTAVGGISRYCIAQREQG